MFMSYKIVDDNNYEDAVNNILFYTKTRGNESKFKRLKLQAIRFDIYCMFKK
jgi:hypothetical protein